MGGQFSVKSDVFSFGVLLLEIVTGIRNAGFSHHEQYPNLPAYVSIRRAMSSSFCLLYSRNSFTFKSNEIPSL